MAGLQLFFKVFFYFGSIAVMILFGIWLVDWFFGVRFWFVKEREVLRRKREEKYYSDKLKRIR